MTRKLRVVITVKKRVRLTVKLKLLQFSMNRLSPMKKANNP